VAGHLKAICHVALCVLLGRRGLSAPAAAGVALALLGVLAYALEDTPAAAAGTAPPPRA
jgi:hypothetical protein